MEKCLLIWRGNILTLTACGKLSFGTKARRSKLVDTLASNNLLAVDIDGSLKFPLVYRESMKSRYWDDFSQYT